MPTYSLRYQSAARFDATSQAIAEEGVKTDLRRMANAQATSDAFGEIFATAMRDAENQQRINGSMAGMQRSRKHMQSLEEIG